MAAFISIGSPPEPAAMTHADLMDKVYRRQQAVYDLTRKYFLLGRDGLIERLAARTGDGVLEIGCGTGRNLIVAARRHPGARLYGVDISAVMLARAAAGVRRSGLETRIRLAAGDAAGFDPEALFGVAQFDRIFFSYAVSMIPDWQQSLSHAASLLAPGGRLMVLDFGQQERLPGWFRRGLRGFLARFHVSPRAELHSVLYRLALERGAKLGFAPRLSGYAWELALTANGPSCPARAAEAA
jgi:S-adenosylmethionine-diacylgycerolhomoserine-N-methlytransferase